MSQCQDLIWKGYFESILPDHPVKSYKQAYNRSHILQMGSHCDLDGHTV